MAARHFLLSGVAKICAALSQITTMQKMIFNAIRLNRPEVEQFILNDDIRFLSYCLARRSRSRSQIMQDLWVCFELGEATGGFFVEFGATNGVKNSNTWLLETQLSWTGLLAEPNPLWHTDLARNRKAAVDKRCVAARSGETVTFLATNDSDPELSGIADTADGDHFAAVRQRGQHIKLETISLDDLLDHHGAPAVIDYLSIDTEGSELDILSGYSFRHRFRTISVENNSRTEHAIDDLLASKGYVRVFRQFSQWDSWYVAADLRDGRRIAVVAPET